MPGIEVQPITDIFTMGTPKVEFMGDFARLTFSVEQTVEGETCRVVVAKLIVSAELARMFVPREPAEIIPFRPRAV